MMWFNKKHPNAVYMDIRREKVIINKGRGNFWELDINPDILGDFRNLPPEIKLLRFKLIAWDVPHFKQAGINSAMRKQYGILGENWREDLVQGFKELWAVLDDYGVLLLKFNTWDISASAVLSLFPVKPLFGNIIKKKPSSTFWFCFMKIPGAQS